MSTWTHVNSCIYFTCIPFLDDLESMIKELENKLGMMVRFGDSFSPGANYKLPEGSEGSLEYTIEKTNDGNRAVRLLVYGDLRDYDSYEKIVNFMDSVVKDTFVRDGFLQIGISGHPERAFIYHHEEKIFIHCGSLKTILE